MLRCPYCLDDLLPQDVVVRCGTCRTPHHQACFRENEGCTSIGCDGVAEVDAGPSLYLRPALRLAAIPGQEQPFGPFRLSWRRLAHVPRSPEGWQARQREAWCRLTLENTELREGETLRGRASLFLPRVARLRRLELRISQGIQRPALIARVQLLPRTGWLRNPPLLPAGLHPFQIELRAPPITPHIDPFVLELVGTRGTLAERLLSERQVLFLLQRALVRGEGMPAMIRPPARGAPALPAPAPAPGAGGQAPARGDGGFAGAALPFAPAARGSAAGPPLPPLGPGGSNFVGDPFRRSGEPDPFRRSAEPDPFRRSGEPGDPLRRSSEPADPFAPAPPPGPHLAPADPFASEALPPAPSSLVDPFGPFVAGNGQPGWQLLALRARGNGVHPRSIAVRYTPSAPAPGELTIQAPDRLTTREMPLTVSGGGPLLSLTLAVVTELVRPGGQAVSAPGLPTTEEVRLLGHEGLPAARYGPEALELRLEVAPEHYRALERARADGAHNAALRFHLALDALGADGRMRASSTRTVTVVPP